MFNSGESDGQRVNSISYVFKQSIKVAAVWTGAWYCIKRYFTYLLHLPSKPEHSLWENVLTITFRSHLTTLRFLENKRALSNSNKSPLEHPGV